MNIASNDSNEAQDSLNGTREIPDNSNSQPHGDICNVIEVVHEKLYDREYPSDRGNYDETVVVIDLKRKIVQCGLSHHISISSPMNPAENFRPIIISQ